MLYETILRKLRRRGICPFCTRKKEFLILENKKSYLTPAQAPYTKDHLLVIPKRHVLTLKNLNGIEKQKMFELVVEGIKILKKRYSAIEVEYKEGNMKLAGKTVPHVHFHLIPKTKAGIVDGKSSRKFLSDKELIAVVKRVKEYNGR